MIRPIVETDYPQLAAIWESAVIATHDFLRPEDFMYYKARLPEYFRYVSLFGYEEEEGRIVGCEAEGNLSVLSDCRRIRLRCCLSTTSPGAKA